MFNGMMDPELMKMAQEQISRMPPGELAKLQQQLMSNPELVRLASEGMKSLNPEDIKNAAEQLKYARTEDMVEISEKMAKATPEEIAAMRAQANAQVSYELNASDILKKQGNELHGLGKYDEASQKYLLAKNNLKRVSFSEGKALHLACSLNLMSCYLKLKQYEDCVKEGSEVMAYDTQNVKALYRRGQAYKELGKYDAAVSDLTKAKELSPEDETIAELLNKTRELVKEQPEQSASGVLIEEITEEQEQPVASSIENSVSETVPKVPSQDSVEDSTVGTSTNYSYGSEMGTPGSSGDGRHAETLMALKDNPEAIRSFHNFMSSANPEALAGLTGAGMTPGMIKTMSNMVSSMSPEEFQRMLELASSMNGLGPQFRPATPERTNVGRSRDSSQTPVDFVGNNADAAATSSSSSSFTQSMPVDMQEQLRRQMKDPAMKQMFSSALKNISPEMMATVGQQFGLKMSREDAAKTQEAMSKLSPDDLERMMVWAERLHKVVDGAKAVKNQLLGRPGLILALVMLFLAVILHWMGYIGS